MNLSEQINMQELLKLVAVAASGDLILWVSA